MAFITKATDDWKTTNPLLYKQNDSLYQKIKRIVDQGRNEYFQASKNIVDPYEVLSHIKGHPRSYYVLREMQHLYPKPSKGLFLCEAPGGFIEATDHKDFTYNACSSNNDVFSSWVKKESIIQLPNKNNGVRNISNAEYILSITKHPDFITADGCLDYTCGQEESEVYSLLLAQLHIALNSLQENGTFIIRIYQMWQNSTQGLLWYLKSLFHEMTFVKPSCAHKCGFDKYVICTGYKRATFEEKYKKSFNSMKSTGSYLEYPIQWGSWLSMVQNKCSTETEKYLEKAIAVVEVLTKHNPFMNYSKLYMIKTTCMRDKNANLFGRNFIASLN